MNVLIVGTGVIGSLYGYALSQKHNVFHYVRQEKLPLLDQKEILLDIIDERKDKNIGIQPEAIHIIVWQMRIAAMI